ncbi:unnamed protein product [Cuscuta campestris]|uniref:Brix domain-containing protein n=1 Tax=Cuscuta campestris TaxID=132261 RepID=A0A484K0H3_9ASTE|nr:unnamed protein product [Cuscuta campestris]
MSKNKSVMVKSNPLVCFVSLLGTELCQKNCRHYTYKKCGGPKPVDLKEIGPRFELQLHKIGLGTLDQDGAQTEWVMRPYMNTSKKRKLLGQ